MKLYKLCETCMFFSMSNNTYKEVLPWRAYNLWICNQSKLTLTKHYALPLLQGPPTDQSSLYSAFKICLGITTLVTPSQKTLVSLDLQITSNVSNYSHRTSLALYHFLYGWTARFLQFSKLLENIIIPLVLTLAW